MSGSGGRRSPGPKVAHAVADLAGRLDIDPAMIVVVSEEEVTWPDSSIGCPRPGMAYAQQLVEGVLVVLEAGGRRYEYHATLTGAPFYCPDPIPPARRR